MQLSMQVNRGDELFQYDCTISQLLKTVFDSTQKTINYSKLGS